MPRLAVLTTHPIQYHAPVYRILAGMAGVDLKVFFGCAQGTRPTHDPNFGVVFKWDVDLTTGYAHDFLSREDIEVLATLSALPLAWQAARAIQRFNPDYVLIMNYSPLFIRLGTWFCKLHGQKLLLRAETADFTRSRSTILSLLRRAGLTLHYKLFRNVFPIGTKSAEHYAHHGVPRGKMKTALYCADSDFLDQQAGHWLPQRDSLRASHAIPPEHFVLLYSGKMFPPKNPFLIPHALAYLPPELLSRCWLVALGDGQMKKLFETECRKVLGERIIFTGFKNQTEIGSYFALADALILPSSTGETWGIVIH